MPAHHEATTKTRPLNIMKAGKHVFPELWLDVYVTGTSFEQQQFAELFVRGRCRKAKTPEEADLVVFAGGDDVDPALYGEKAHYTTHFLRERDEADKLLYDLCLSQGIPMLGICRGAQFLHVMQGGKLYQDVDGHTGDHNMYDVIEKRVLPRISSVHHQMVILNDRMILVGACSGRSKVRHLNPTLRDEGSNRDVEAYIYREPCIIGIQGHPEYRGYDDFAQWTLNLLHKTLNENPDLHYLKGHLRIKPELLAESLAMNEQQETTE